MKGSCAGKTILITGATGLLGQALVKYALNENMSVVASVRDEQRGRSLFGSSSAITYLESDIVDLPLKNMDIDYVVHAAANTSSNAFISDPVGIINTNYQGTLRTLEFAKINCVTKYLYLSTMEIYGYPDTDEKITETHSSNLDILNVRSSYPESKRLCETLCSSYMNQYNIPINVCRLIQTIGPGVKYNDNRIFAQFARCVVEGNDIVLHTKGETKRSYLYLDDAITAIFTILEKGIPGEAYNVTNESTYCSIYDMAHLVADECAAGEIGVLIDESESKDHGYAPVLKMNLCSKKLRELGWEPTVDLKEMFNKLIEDMREQKARLSIH